MNQVIRGYVDGGYVFHGSIHNDLRILIPKKPRDVGADSRNKEVAVYATQDVSGAIIFSLIKGLHGVFQVNRSANGVTTACFAKVFFEQLSLNVGSLYILRKEDFTISEQWQLKAYRPVESVDRIDVCLQDFYDFGGELTFR